VARRSAVEFVDDLEEEKAAPEPLRRVKVLPPFQVVHEAVVYRPHAIAEVPESVAAQFILNRWVTDDTSD
jgi:hypothetical protein